MFFILIVDDDENLLASLRRSLKAVPEFQVATATGGEEALGLLAARHFDLALLDVMMPGLGGYDLCRRIREDPSQRFLKIVFLSGNTTTASRLEGYRAGADDYLGKPIDNAELLAKIRAYSRLKRVEELDDVKGRLLSLFAHETRTPLSVVINAAEALAGDDRIPGDAKELLLDIRDSGLRLSAFANKTLRLCQLRCGVSPRCTRELAAARLGALAAGQAALAAAGDARILVEADPSLECRADWALLDEALRHLLDNALRHTPRGGCVRLQAAASDGQVQFRVVDQGPGIPRERRARIFEAFSAGDIMHHQHGHGLGLAIVRAVADLHLGSVALSEAPGGGAVFTLSLPAGAAEPAMTVAGARTSG